MQTRKTIRSFSAWLLLCLLCLTNLGRAQQPFGYVDLSIGGGYLAPIYEPFPSTTACTSVEVSFFKSNIIGPTWRDNYSRTRLGWSAQFIDLGNSKILGQAFSVAPLAEYTKRLSDQSSVHLGMAIGIGAFTRRYDPIDNPTNTVIGSRIGNVSRFSMEYYKQIHPQWRMGLGVHFIHSSNAHFAVPNVGANIIGGHISISKNHIRSDKDINVILLLVGYNRRWNIHAGAGYGLHEFNGTSRPTDGPLFKDPTAYLQMGKVHRSRSSVYAGMQWVDCRSHRYFLLHNELVHASELRKKTQNFMAYVGYDWFFPHGSFFVQMGLNLYHPSMGLIQSIEPDAKRGWFYQKTVSKLGYRLYLFDPIKTRKISPYFQFGVKTNGGTANFLETTVGIKID